MNSLAEGKGTTSLKTGLSSLRTGVTSLSSLRKGVLIVTDTILRDARIMHDNLRMTDNG